MNDRDLYELVRTLGSSKPKMREGYAKLVPQHIGNQQHRATNVESH